jgi:hypothetical protein
MGGKSRPKEFFSGAIRQRGYLPRGYLFALRAIRQKRTKKGLRQGRSKRGAQEVEPLDDVPR